MEPRVPCSNRRNYFIQHSFSEETRNLVRYSFGDRILQINTNWHHYKGIGMTLPPPSKETIQSVRASVGVNEEMIKEALNYLKQWLKFQPHLPHDHEDGPLEQLYIRCKASTERAKASLDMYYTLRTVLPEVFCARDPSAPWFKQASDLVFFVPLPQLTADYCRVTVTGVQDADIAGYNVFDVLKLVFMIQDIRYAEDYCSSDIYIIDGQYGSTAHMAKYTLPVLKKLEVCAMKGYSARMKEVHYINTPPFMDAFINLVKTLLKPKLAARIHVHRKGYESLYKHVSPKILPLEYGGEAGSLRELWYAWKTKIESHRSWFLDQEKMTSDETKRPNKTINSTDLFGFEGSFRKLCVD